MSWSRRLRAAAVHLQRFCYEEVHGYVDRCTVCHADLKGYEDGRCVCCANIVFCRECVQFYDPEFHDSKGRDISRFPSVFGPAERGDAVCLQCGIVSDVGNSRRHLLSGMIRAANAIDALLRRGDFHPTKTLPRLYFHLWKEACLFQGIKI